MEAKSCGAGLSRIIVYIQWWMRLLYLARLHAVVATLRTACRLTPQASKSLSDSAENLAKRIVS